MSTLFRKDNKISFIDENSNLFPIQKHDEFNNIVFFFRFEYKKV